MYRHFPNLVKKLYWPHPELEMPVAKLAKPVWPRTQPTIPSTFFKAEFQVGLFLFWRQAIIIEFLS
jgi:hypothetical protein